MSHLLNLSISQSLLRPQTLLLLNHKLQLTHPRAGAVFHPDRHASPLHQRMQRTSFAFYRALALSTPVSGVQLYSMTEYLDDVSSDVGIWYKDLMPNYRVLPASELPRGMQLGLKYTSLAINPLVFLLWLRKELESRAVRFVRKEVGSLDEARKLTTAKVVVNASGNGARALAHDETATPIRGQTMFVKTDYAGCLMIDGVRDYTYIIPRPLSGGVIIGGIKSSRTDAEVDHSLKPDILRRVNEATNGAFEGLDVNGEEVTDIVGFRPGRKGGLRVEIEGEVVHAYGVGGAGYIYSFGVAERVRELVEKGRKAGKSKL